MGRTRRKNDIGHIYGAVNSAADIRRINGVIRREMDRATAREDLTELFHAPVEALTAVPTLCGALRDRLPSDLVVVSPDAGRVSLATYYAQCLGTPAIVLHKRRESGAQTAVTHVVGDVAGRACLIVDEIISTGGTVAASVTALLQAGARPR